MNRVFAVTFAGLGVVLLTIAIVMTPMVCGGNFPLDYYFSWSARVFTGTERDLLITIKADESMFVGQDWVPTRDFSNYLLNVTRRTPGRSIIIRADRNVPSRAVRTVLAAVRATGVRRITLLTFRGTMFDLLADQRSSSRRI